MATSTLKPPETKFCRCLVVDVVDGNVSLCGRSWVCTAEDDLSIDVQGRRRAARGQDQFFVAEAVGTHVVVVKGPNNCGPERSLEEGKPGKPIVRLLSRLDPILQTCKAGVGGLVHGDLEAVRVVEIYIKVAVLPVVGNGVATPDVCEICPKFQSELGPISALDNFNTICRAPAARVSNTLDIDHGGVKGGLLRGGGRRGYCCAETKNDRGDK